jgi:hypothetical protein
MTTTAYLRLSPGSQDVAQQKLATLEYARGKKCPIDDIVEIQMAWRKNLQERGIDGRRNRPAPGDRLLVSELSGPGRKQGSKASLARIVAVTRSTIRRFIETRRPDREVSNHGEIGNQTIQMRNTLCHRRTQAVSLSR